MKPKRSIAWILVGLLWLLFLGLILSIYVLYPESIGDFPAYYQTARAVVAGEPLYVNSILKSADGDSIDPSRSVQIPSLKMASEASIAWSYIYPPLLAQVLAPVAAIADQHTAALVWFGINAGLLVVTTALISRRLASHRQRIMLWLVTPLFAPTFMSFWFGQVTIILFALIAGAWVAYRENKPTLTGVLLVLGAWIKLYPALLILYFLYKREWRVLVSVAITAVATGLLQIAISGTSTFIYYVKDVLPGLAVEGQPALNHSNNAVLGFAQKLFSESPQIIPLLNNPTLVSLTRYSLLIGLVGLTLFLISRPITLSRTSSDQFDLEYAAVLLLALLTGSTLHLHGMLSALLAFVILLRSGYSLPRQTRRQLKFLSLLAAMLINVHLLISVGYLQRSPNNALPALALSLPFFGMMLLWGMVCYVLYQQRQTGAVPAPVAQAAAAD